MLCSVMHIALTVSTGDHSLPRIEAHICIAVISVS